VCDQAQAMDCAFPATTPLMLARYAAIAAGETLVSDFVATGSIWYVIDGRGTSAFNGEVLSWGPGDVFMLPGGSVAIHTAAERAVLWLVSNEPQLAVDAAMPHPPTGGPIEPVHYPAAEIERQIGIIDESTANETTSGLDLIFSSDRLEANRNTMPTLTLSLNTLPARSSARAPAQFDSDHARRVRRRLLFDGRWQAMRLECLGHARDAAGRAAFAS